MIIHCETTRFILEVLERGEYSYLFDDLIVLDAGCNIGAFSLWIAPRAKVVHAVDLAPENIENLNKTLKENGIGNIKTYCVALTGKDGTRWASDLGDTAGNGGWQIKDIVGEGIKVDGYTIESFMKRSGIDRVDVLKLDVEGAEYEILNSPDFPASKISTIIGEFHGDVDISDRLVDLGYQYRDFGNHFIARR